MSVAGKIGFVGGGLMAEALIKGLLQAGVVSADQIMAADPAAARCDLLRDRYGIAVFADARAMLGECDTVILAVKPQVMGGVLDSLVEVVTDRHLVISIAAGVTISFIEGTLAGTNCRVIRVMPNTPAIVQEAASALSSGLRATAADMETAQAIFDAIGQSVVVDETYLDAVTGLSGSGPAYVFSFLEALIDAGVKVGLPRPIAETLSLQTVMGSVKLAMETGDHPAQLRAMVTSPGGTTIAGLHVLERGGMQGLIMDAVESATDRSRALGAASGKKDKS
ncbi:MAG: pyrroline-5-carboxylate reductase [Desulfobulbaceae bacterium]|nr:pyrroline-5-carboxylate reductase [Desulfobulbaceae bacterium]